MDQNLIAVIVGFVEGVTEFLPVSSTGHMIIVGHMLGFDGPAAFTVAIGLVLGALLMMYAEYKTKDNQAELLDDLDKISLKQAALVGAFQLLSLWPGFSRSGSTLAGGLLVGLKRETAANYTFLIAVPLMFVACLYDLLKNISILTVDDLQMLAIGFVVAFVVAYWSVLWFLKFLHKYSLTSFAYYRIILAVAALTYFYF